MGKSRHIQFGKVDCIWPGVAEIHYGLDIHREVSRSFVIDRGGLGNGFLFVYYWVGDKALAV